VIYKILVAKFNILELNGVRKIRQDWRHYFANKKEILKRVSYCSLRGREFMVSGEGRRRGGWEI
jgi:hypothetical protein